MVLRRPGHGQDHGCPHRRAVLADRDPNPRDYQTPLHVNYAEDEMFWILEGEVTFQVGDQTIVAGEGSFLYGPRDVPHKFSTADPATLLFLFTPGGFEDFVKAIGAPAAELAPPPPAVGPPDMETLQRIAREYDKELLI